MMRASEIDENVAGKLVLMFIFVIILFCLHISRIPDIIIVFYGSIFCLNAGIYNNITNKLPYYLCELEIGYLK